MIVSLEGLPGAGKTTQARMLTDHLTETGLRVAYLPDLATLTTDPLGDRLFDLFAASGDPFKRSGDVVLDTHLAAAIRTHITATLITRPWPTTTSSSKTGDCTPCSPTAWPPS